MLVYLWIDVAVDHEQVEPAIVIEIDEAVAPSDKRNRCLCNAYLIADVGETGVPVVVIHHLVIVAKVGYEKINQPVVFIVAGRNSHRGNFAPILVQRETGDVALIVKRAISFIDVKKVWLGVVSHHQVRFAVAIDVNKNDGKAEVGILVFNTRLHRDVGKFSFAVVVKQVIRLARQSARSAIYCHAAVKAGRIVDGLGSGDGQVVAVKMHVAGDVEIEQSVAVVIAPTGTGRPVAKRYACGFGYIGKCAVMIVVVETVFAVVADVHVGPSIVVVVRDAHAISPTIVGYPSLGSHIGERAVVVVMKQRRVRRLFLAIECIEGRSVDQVNVEPAVIVVVDQADTRAVGFDDEILLWHAHLVL